MFSNGKESIVNKMSIETSSTTFNEEDTEKLQRHPQPLKQNG